MKIYDNAIADSANVGDPKHNIAQRWGSFPPSAVKRVAESFPAIGVRRLLPQEAQ